MNSLISIKKHAGKTLYPLAILVAIGIAVLGFFVSKNASNLLSLYLVLMPLALVELFYCINTFFLTPKESSFGKTDWRLFAKLLLVVFSLAVLLEMGTLIGSKMASPLVLSNWRPKRFLIFFCVLFSTGLFAVEYRSDDCKAADWVSSIKSYLGSHLVTSITLLALLIVFFACIWNCSAATSYIAILFLLAICIVVVRGISKHLCTLQCGFACIAFAIGLISITVFPAGNLLSWDDEVHYNRALAVSYISDVELTKSDRMVTSLFAQEDGFSRDATFDRWNGASPNWNAVWNYESNASFFKELDENNSVDGILALPGLSSTALEISSIAYVPSAIGLWVGRLLNLPFTICFALGRIGNLLAYVGVVALAIKVAPKKKGLLAAIGLIPTNLFMASNYSYDPCVTSFMLLGFSLAYRQFESNERLTIHGFFAVMLAFLIGLMPKAVYVPMLAIMFFMPRSKFRRATDRGAYYLTGVLFAFAMVATILVPMVASNGGGSGDSRGGTGVNSSAQVSRTLADPLDTFGVVNNFMFKEYLIPSNVDLALTNYAYLGSLQNSYPFISGLPLLALFGVALTDCADDKARMLTVSRRLAVVGLVLLTVFMSSLALYFSFTAVGLRTVAGMQPRYLIPLLFPVLSITFGVRARKCSSDVRYGSGVIGFFASLNLACVWLLLLSRLI